MKMASIKVYLALLPLLLLGMDARALTIDLDSLNNTHSNPVTVFLEAGTYEVTPIDGAYESWNAWGRVRRCDSDGENCRNGWINNYSIRSDELGSFTVSNGVRYETAELALANIIASSFTLTSGASVDFFINDSYYGDNIGGISLEVSPVPLPGAVWLFGSAMLGFIGFKRKLRNSEPQSTC